MWGKNLLVVPVVERGATTRRVYLPPTAWYDFWTGERIEGGREISRPIDLETLPLYVQAGSILPLGQVKQFVDEKVDGPLSVSIYPGADASFLLYEDDGISFNYRKGHWTGMQMTWNDSNRKFDLTLASGSRLMPPEKRTIEVKLGGITKTIDFAGKPVSILFGS